MGRAVVAGRSGVGPITLFDPDGFPVRIAAEVPGFDAEAVFGRRRARHLDRVTQLALVATGEAMESAKLDVGADPDRVGVVFGTGIGGIRSLEEGMAVLNERGPDWVSPYTLPMMIPNMVAGQIAMEWGIRGYSSCTVTACSASAQAIGEGLDLIRAGRADAVVCGGSEAPITRVAVAGFAAMKALSTRNDEPERRLASLRCRPGRVRDGGGGRRAGAGGAGSVPGAGARRSWPSWPATGPRPTPTT